MAKVLSLASWNVEHFKGKPERITRVVDFLNDQTPDVFALYEVEGKDVFGTLVQRMAGYSFHITEGPQTQEILVGAKRGITAFFTQRAEFKTGNSFLRPGALLTVHKDNENYSFLFLHTKSGPQPVGLGIRDEMFQRAIKFKKVLDKAAGGKGKANFMFVGDLNVMGMKYFPTAKSIGPDVELNKLRRDVKKVKMRVLGKSAPHTWWNGPGSSFPKSDLDQVVASEQLTFKKFASADVDVRGWPKEPTDAKQGEWISKFSDHGLLYLEITK